MNEVAAPHQHGGVLNTQPDVPDNLREMSPSEENAEYNRLARRQ